uniref:Hydroxyproline O-arabinosyltransferase-like domain-containing protein n=1 Tax=Leersia perrieri TaxID=77586 RepID=A0A0D9WG06_9ORYZ
MSGRKNAGKASPCLLLLISVGCFFATYNFLTMVAHGRGRDGPRKMLGGGAFAAGSDPSKRFHVALTATDALYSQWQSRIMYYWYREMRSRPGSDMGGFTRILHSGKPDGLMDEIPTLVVDPLPEGTDRGYIVLNRPWAFVQWLKKADIKEEICSYVLMAEPDHVFVRPLPNLARGDEPAAFPFFYIKPTENEKILRKFFPEEKGPVSKIDPIGNSPVIIKKLHLDLNLYTLISYCIHVNRYAYAVASALHGVHHNLRKDFMIQPPWDLKTEGTFIIHYTYGCDYTLKGELTYGKIGEWRFDKRSYLRSPPPRNLTLPPPGVPESVATLVKMVNEATANIPGWDEER